MFVLSRSILFYKTAACNLGLPLADSAPRRKIRLIEGNAICRHLKKLTCKGALRQMFISLRPKTPYPPLHTVYVYTVYFFTQGRGRGLNQREGERGNMQGRSHSWVKNANWVFAKNRLSPIYKL